jgi:hypothetical protein
MKNVETIRDDVGDSLLEMLCTGGVISESKKSSIVVSSEIVMERLQDPNVYIIKTSKRDTGEEVEIGIGRDEFLRAYNKLHLSGVDILNEFRLLQNTSLTSETHQGYAPKLRDMVSWYNKHSTDGDVFLVSLSDRIRLARSGFVTYLEAWESGAVDGSGVSSKAPSVDNDEYIDFFTQSTQEYVPDRDSIDRGRRFVPRNRKATQIVDRINDMELMKGELYNDISKIPKPAVYSWLKLFKKEVEGVGIAGEGKKRVWKRSFILGYQIDDRVLHEIWYHSLDGTFGVYDYFGNIRGKRYLTMNEAVRGLINASLRFSPDDREFFQNPANRSLADSFFRPLVSTTDQYAKDMLRRESEQASKEEQKRSDEIKANNQEDLRKDADVEQREQRMKALKTAIKNATSPKVDSVVSSVKDKARETRQEFDDLIKAGSRDKFGTPPTKKPISNIVMATFDSWDDASDGFIAFYLWIMSNLETVVRRRGAVLTRMVTQYSKDVLSEVDVARIKAVLARIDEAIMVKEKTASRGAFVAYMRGKSFIKDDMFDEREAFRIANVIWPDKNKPKTDEEAVTRQYIDAMKKSNETQKSAETVTESIFDQGDEISSFADQLEDHINDPSYMNKIQDTRRTFHAQESATFKNIQNIILGSIIKYDDTRLNANTIGRMISTYIGKHATGKRFWDKVKKFFMSETERAEFIGGYSLNNRVFYEVWYIVQADVSRGEGVIASFFLFDVTSGTPRLIRGSMPYLRNAEQSLLQVVGIIKK